MSAWAKLLASSSLAFGTAWDLITHPKTGGSGVVVNNGCTVSIASNPVQVSIANDARQITLGYASTAVAIGTTPIIASLGGTINCTIDTRSIQL